MTAIKFFFVIAAIIYTNVFTPGTNAKKPNKIVGGSKANITQYPWAVVIENGWTHQTCGGCLISIKHVLTAAHCIVRGREERDPYMYQKRYYNVKSGSSNRKDIDKVLLSPVCDINIHKKFLNYPPTASGDIAVLTLCEPITVGPTRAPALLPTRQYGNGEKGVILGWGWTEPENSMSIDDLKKAPMTITGIDDDYLLAIAREGVAFCNGDSGGPLLVDGCVVGVISNSPDCTGKTEGCYTNVYAFKTWIEDVMNFGGQSIFSGYVRTMKIRKISNRR